MSLNLNPIPDAFSDSDENHGDDVDVDVDIDIADTVPSSLDISNSSSANLSPRKGAGALLNTSSFARRLADGNPTPQEHELATQASGEMEGETPPPSQESELRGSVTASTSRASSVTSFQQCPQDGISSDIKRGILIPAESEIAYATSGSTKSSEALEGGVGDEQNVDNAADNAVVKSEPNAVEDDVLAKAATEVKPATDNKTASVKEAPMASIRGPSVTPSRNTHGQSNNSSSNNNNNNKNPFDAFGEYITSMFQKAEVYEEELERRQSRRDLQGNNMDSTHHGASKRNIIEGGDSISSEGGIIDDKMNEGSAAVKHDPKEEHLLDEGDEAHDQKKQKVADDVKPNVVLEEVVDEATKNMWKEQWEVFVAEKKKNKFTDVAIESLALPLTVDDFYHSVLEDGATHSIEKFMVDIGELNVSTTPWEPSQAPTATEPTARTMQYTHPVNAPMAPPTAKARKQQSLYKFGNVGLCLETCTVVQEVPMADCFVVDDRIWVREADGGGCTVAVTFNIRFIKSTMFRRIIENQTRKEYESFWNQFGDMIQSLKSSLAPEEDELEEVALELEEATAMMIDEEGQEMLVSASVLARIRTSSRRLSEVALLSPRAPSKRMVAFEEVEEKMPAGYSAQGVMKAVLDVIGYLRKEISEGDYGFAIVCMIIFFLVLLNLVALKQMMTMNGFLHDLDSRLEKMNEVNEVLLSKLANIGDADDASCPG